MKKHGNSGNQNAVKSEILDGAYSGRCKREEKAAWVKVAQANGQSLQVFTREILNKYANSILNPPNCPKCESKNYTVYSNSGYVGDQRCDDCGYE